MGSNLVAGPGGLKAKERLGICKLHESKYKRQPLKTPSIEAAFEGLPLQEDPYELPFEWSDSLKQKVVLEVCWTVSGLPFRTLQEVDHRNNWKDKLTFRHAVDTPIALVKQKLNIEGRPPQYLPNIQGKFAFDCLCERGFCDCMVGLVR